MSNLEKSIADWRRQMLAAGIKTPVPLEELEIHLREEIERQMKLELNEQEALEISVQQIGQPKMLKNEFKKSERNIMTKAAMILLGIFGVLFGTAMILPALHLYNEQGMVHDAVVGFLFGIPITLVGISSAIWGFKTRKA
jgi:hypothetical protein